MKYVNQNLCVTTKSRLGDHGRSPTEVIHLMHHLPHGKSWDPMRVARVLCRNGVPASVDGTLVRIEVPDTEPPSILGTFVRWVLRSRPNVVTINHDPTHFLRNIDVHHDPLKVSTDPAHLHDITVALRECGYMVKTDREIAEGYCPNSEELRTMFDAMERLQREKENLVAAQDFEATKLKLEEERGVRKQIDACLFRAVG